MDGDKVPEVVIELRAESLFGVLHYNKDKVEGYIYSNRQLWQLKADGTFTWSGGASYWGYGKLNFESINDYETDDIGHLEGESNNGVSTITYYIDNKPVTEDIFNSFVEKQDAKPDATWYEFSQKNIDAAFQIWLFKSSRWQSDHHFAILLAIQFFTFSCTTLTIQ